MASKKQDNAPDFVTDIQDARRKKQSSTGIDFSTLTLPHTATDRPEFIKSGELMQFHPFTIYRAEERPGEYGPRIFFSVAYKIDDKTIKRVWTPAVNDERRAIMRVVKAKGALKNCRVIEVPTGGRFDEYKIIAEADDPQKHIDAALAAIKVRQQESDDDILSDDDIPF